MSNFNKVISTNYDSEDETFEIQEVWQSNFLTEIKKIMYLIDEYNCIAIDTEFSGIKYSQTSNRDGRDPFELDYQKIKKNVDELNLIQIGLTLSNKKKECPQPISTWQFNIKFDVDKDVSVAESIELLRSAGIKFNRLKEEGIEGSLVAEYFISSGLVLNDNIKWITFHGGFDLAYLLKILLNESLPNSEEEFMRFLKIYFPVTYDLKFMIKEFEALKFSSLQKLAQDLSLPRLGKMHQAGSDSLLTLKAFNEIKSIYFRNEINDAIHLNKIYGLCTDENSYSSSSKMETHFTYYNNYPPYYLPMMPMANESYDPYYYTGYTQFNYNYQTANMYQDKNSVKKML